MLTVTTDVVEGKRIKRHLGIVTGVVGVDVDYENISMGQGGGMLMVSLSGTAVVLE